MTRDGERRAIGGPAGIRAPTANLDSVSGASTLRQVLRLAIKVAYGCGSAPGFDRLPLKKSLKLNAMRLPHNPLMRRPPPARRGWVLRPGLLPRRWYRATSLSSA